LKHRIKLFWMSHGSVQHWAICWTMLSSQQPCFLSFSCCLVEQYQQWLFFSKWWTTVMTRPYMLTFQKQDHEKPKDKHQSEKPAANIWYSDFWFNHLYVISAKHNCTPPKNTGLVNPAVVLHDISLGHVCSTYLTSKLAAIHSKGVNCHPDYSTHKSSACRPVFLLIPYNW
jgi:hypothetical protein